jgi:hypothetical protein
VRPQGACAKIVSIQVVSRNPPAVQSATDIIAYDESLFAMNCRKKSVFRNLVVKQ